MTHYNDVLEELKRSASKIAEHHITQLYHILVDEEGKSPQDAKGILEQDLIDTFSRATIRKYLPEECKDKTKQRAGKIGREKQLAQQKEQESRLWYKPKQME